MTAVGALSLTAALLLFGGGVLLGLYFDLPAIDEPARASLGAEAEAAVEKALSARTTKPVADPDSGGSVEPSRGTEPSGGASSGDAAPSADPASSGDAGPPGDPGSGGGAPAGGGVPAAPAPPQEPTAPAPARAAAPAPAPPPPAPAERPVRTAQPVLAAALAAVPAVQPALAGAPARAGASFTVQIGAYSVEDNARREISSLEAAGYQPYVVTVTSPAGRRLHTVLLGAYEDRREADSAAARFATRQGRKVWVRPLDP